MNRYFLLLAVILTVTMHHRANAQTDSKAADLHAYPSLASFDSTIAASHRSVMVNDTTCIAYFKPKPYEFITNLPKDWVEFGKRTITKKGLIATGAIAATTALLIAIDRPAIDAVQQFGRWSGISGERKFANAIKFKAGGTEVNFLDLPQNFNSTLYFIGEEWPTIAFTAGVLVRGILKNDSRAILTASQIGEGYLAMGITVQLIKRLTGRQSPFRTESGSGSWQLAPSYSHYQNDVPNHDAFPSGHLATAMATVTIYAENYPEYKLIRPIGYTVIGIVGLAMMNNGVHWLSDYPLALAIGYTYGKIVTSRGKTIGFIKRMGPGADKGKLSFVPTIIDNRSLGMSLRLNL